MYGHIRRDEAAEFVMRGSYQERSFNLFYHRDRRLLAAVSVNRHKDASAAIKLIETGVQIDPSDLADASVDMKLLVNRAVGP
jgi:hypothetical protein